MAEEMPSVEPVPISDLDAEIRALCERLQHDWMREVGSWAEYDALHVKLRELRSRVQPTPVAEPWKDPNFISNLMDPGGF